MKKRIAFLLIILVLALLGSNTAFAANEPFDDTPYTTTSYILFDQHTGDMLHQKSPDEKIYPASTTKLMTALLLLEEKGLEGEMTVGEEVNPFNAETSTLMNLIQNETIPVKDVFYGLLLPSGNDAAAAIAVHVSGSVDAFVARMNERAKELGMNNTNFVNPHGLAPEYANDTHYSTAADMAKLAFEVSKHEEILEAVKTQSYTVKPTNLKAEERVLQNTNYLMNTPPNRAEDEEIVDMRYQYATGMKTGLTQNMLIGPEEEYVGWNGCLVASAEKDGVALVAVIYGDNTEKARERWRLAVNLFEYGFARHIKVDISQYIQPVQMEEQLSNFAEDDAAQGMLALSTASNMEIPESVAVDSETAAALADGSLTIESSVEITKPLEAPVAENEEMGTVTYTINGEALFSVPLVATRQVLAAEGSAEGQEQNGTGDTKKTDAEEGVPWYLFIIIPAAAVAALLVIRMVNLHRRRMRSRRRMNRTRRSSNRRYRR
ncbi:MAG: D-alanyl-D-alanine carboxypeptidase family protein [Christensenellaceae bacterium]